MRVKLLLPMWNAHGWLAVIAEWIFGTGAVAMLILLAFAIVRVL